MLIFTGKFTIFTRKSDDFYKKNRVDFTPTFDDFSEKFDHLMHWQQSCDFTSTIINEMPIFISLSNTSSAKLAP